MKIILVFMIKDISLKKWNTNQTQAQMGTRVVAPCLTGDGKGEKYSQNARFLHSCNINGRRKEISLTTVIVILSSVLLKVPNYHLLLRLSQAKPYKTQYYSGARQCCLAVELRTEIVSFN